MGINPSRCIRKAHCQMGQIAAEGIIHPSLYEHPGAAQFTRYWGVVTQMQQSWAKKCPLVIFRYH